MLEAIRAATTTVRLEMYIFADDATGRAFREALVAARQRGVRVQVLLDAVGSLPLPTSFWAPLVALGGEFRWFNPLRSAERFGFRNHRKLLCIDHEVAFIGGFNLSDDYRGDGVAHGWRDLGLEVHGGAVTALETSFNDLFARAADRPTHFPTLHRQGPKIVRGVNWALLLCGPRRGHGALRRALVRDLSRAKEVRIECAYFLPTHRLRRALMAVARRGGRVQLIMAGRSDVPLSRLAAQSLYARLLRAGVEIYEYQPQVLHSKLFLIDGVAYAGSANLDARSLRLNYELSLRIEDAEAAAQGRALFEADLAHCRRIDAASWPTSRSLWRRWLERAAYFLLARIDPWLTSQRWRTRASRALERRGEDA